MAITATSRKIVVCIQFLLKKNSVKIEKLCGNFQHLLNVFFLDFKCNAENDQFLCANKSKCISIDELCDGKNGKPLEIRFLCPISAKWFHINFLSLQIVLTAVTSSIYATHNGYKTNAPQKSAQIWLNVCSIPEVQYACAKPAIS